MEAKTQRHALTPGSQLHWYRIDQVLGQGSFGITYLAYDLNLHRRVAIKQYWPVEIAIREGMISMHHLSCERNEQYQWGLERFIAEARMLAKFEHPNIVRVLNVFEANDTAYMVMSYEDGENFRQVLKRRKILEETELLTVLLPIIDGLEKVHQSGFIHRDIKPSNIFIRTDGSPVLLDFGSARYSVGEQRGTITSIFSPGYAPIEQYYGKGEHQGPWTDIYGLGATLYEGIAGNPPTDALARSQGILQTANDPLILAILVGEGRYSERFLKAVDHALSFHPRDRPQTLAEWRRDFFLTPLTLGDEVGQPLATESTMVDMLAVAMLPPLAPEDSWRKEHAERRRALHNRIQARAAAWRWGILLVLGMALLGGGLVVWLAKDRSLVSLGKATAQRQEPLSEASTDTLNPDQNVSTKGIPPAVRPWAEPPAPTQDQGRREQATVDENSRQEQKSEAHQGSPVMQREAKRKEAERTVDKLLKLGGQAMQRGELEVAQSYLDQASAILPGYQGIAFLREALKKRQTVTPERLALPPSSKKNGGTGQLARLIDLTVRAMDKGDFELAQHYIEQAMAVHPEDPNVVLLQDELISRRAQAEQNLLARQNERTVDEPDPGNQESFWGHKVTVKIQTATASHSTAQPGDTVIFATEFSLTLPAGQRVQYVQVTWILKRNGKRVGEEGVVKGKFKAGLNSVTNHLTLPPRVMPGQYVVEHRVQAGSSYDVAYSRFSVGS